MHELSIASSIIDAVLQSLKGKEIERIIEVELDIGELSSVSGDQLKFGFESLSRGTPVENASLKINIVPGRIECQECGHLKEICFHDLMSGISLICPECNSRDMENVDGEGITIKNIRAEIAD